MGRDFCLSPLPILVKANVLPNIGCATSGGTRFDFITDPAGSSAPAQDKILVSFPVPYYFGTQNFFLPEDSYFEINDSELYITSSEAAVLNNYSITLYYT